jgi:hypothetical protein
MTKPDLERVAIYSKLDRRKPKFGAWSMLLIAGGAILVAGLFIFFVAYGLAYM